MQKTMKKTVVQTVEKVWLSGPELQKYLGVGKDVVDMLRETGRIIPYYLSRKTVLYNKKNIDNMVLKSK